MCKFFFNCFKCLHLCSSRWKNAPRKVKDEENESEVRELAVSAEPTLGRAQAPRFCIYTHPERQMLEGKNSKCTLNSIRD